MTPERITLLQSKGPLLTKTWLADGTIKGYDRAKNYHSWSLEVSNIQELSELLSLYETEPRVVVIRGQHKSGVGAELVETERTLEAFEEVPHHWICIDVDSFKPVLADPVAEPAAAVAEFIDSCLPAEFRGAAHHWQLSSSAGKPGGEDTLRAHVWFWLSEPRGQVELEGWARGLQLPIDVTVFRTVQPIYTAAPVIEDGAVCPVKVRSGFTPGANSVDLSIPDTILDTARRTSADRKSMKDPTQKTGVVGAFCRHYSPARVIDEDLVPGAFEWQDDSDVRINWLTSSSGSAGGVCITDDQLHFFCSHNEDPFEGRAANAWDFVRVHRFGELDDTIDPDARDWLMQTGGMPSHKAMVEFARTFPEVAEELEEQAEARAEEKQELAEQERQARLAHLADLQAGVLKCQDVEALKAYVAQVLRVDDTIDDLDRNGALTVSVQARFAALGSPQGRADVRKLLQPPVNTAGSASGPDWLDDWVYLTNGDRFFCLTSKEDVSGRGFDATNNRFMPMASDGIHRESATDYALNVWHIDTAYDAVYAPGHDAVFEMLGRRWANEYREETVPQAGPGGEAAIRMVQDHLKRLVPDDRERGILLSWMAQNVRHPGRKIRWAPYVCGGQGTGKTFLAELLGMVMGEANTRIVDGENLVSPFNGWAIGAAVVAIEEVYQTGHLFEVGEKLKGVVANNRISLHKKGKDPFTAPNFSNYLLLSNHMDGLPVDEGDRRYFFVKTAITSEQAKALAAEGYYTNLFDTCRGAVAGLRRWLIEEVQMHPEFDPDGRAPETATRQAVIELSKSDADVAVGDLLRESNAVTTASVVAHLTRRGVGEVKSRGLARLLTAHGFEFHKSMWVHGATRRVYVRSSWKVGRTPAEIAAELQRIPEGFEDDLE